MKKKKNKERSVFTPILVILLIIVVIISFKSKAPAVEEAQQVEETPAEVPVETPELIEAEKPKEIEQISLEENIIEIREDAFYPKEKTIGKNTEIKWIKKDPRDYKIVCYLKGTRVIQSPDLNEGDSFMYDFLEDGEYTCITVPYGLRSTIIVETQPLLSPTGGAIIGNGKRMDGASFIGIILIAITALLYYVGIKRKQ